MILVVAPEQSQRDALAVLAAEPEAPVVEAPDAHVAFELLRRHRAIRTVFTVAELPIVDGARLVEQALALRPGLQARVVDERGLVAGVRTADVSTSCSPLAFR